MTAGPQTALEDRRWFYNQELWLFSEAVISRDESQRERTRQFCSSSRDYDCLRNEVNLLSCE